MLNLTRLHLGIAHESQFQGLGITGSPSAHAGAFTSRPPLRHGSIRSSGSSRSSPSSRSSEERINRSQSWRRPSTPSSTLAMRTPLRSNGPNPPTTSWLLSSASAAELSQSTQKLNRNFGIGTLGGGGVCTARAIIKAADGFDYPSGIERCRRPSHLLLKFPGLRPHAVASGFPFDQESAPAAGSTDEGKAEKVESFRFSEPR